MTRSAQRSLCAAMLSLQAVVLFLTGVATIGMSDIGTGASLSLGLGLALLCVLAAGLLRFRIGFLLGHLVQVVSIGLGFVTTPMFFLGAVFAALWVAAYVLGDRIDRERAEREVLEQEWQAEHGPDGAR
jgi:hypothetical protein